MKPKETETVVSTETKTTVPLFSVEKLRSSCYALFGVTTSTFDGAMYGRKGEFSVEETKALIKKWNKKEVR